MYFFASITSLTKCTLKHVSIGINASGIRKVINAPSRYAIPLIVSTGIPYDPSKSAMSINVLDGTGFDDRYRFDELMFGNFFGSALPVMDLKKSS